MLTGKRRTDRVRRAIEELLSRQTEAAGFVPGDVNRILREENQPMGAWEVRGELSRLERAGELEFDATSGVWYRSGLRRSA